MPHIWQQCYACGGLNHYTALCKQKNRRTKQYHNTLQWGQNNPQRNTSRQRGRCPSRSPGRQPCHHHSQSSNTSHSHNHSPSHSALPHQSHWLHHWQTPHRYHQDSIDVILTNSIKTPDQLPEGPLYMERSSDRQIAFLTWLQLPTQERKKLMMVKIDPGAQVNTIPLSRYCTLFPTKLNKSRAPRPMPYSLQPIPGCPMMAQQSPSYVTFQQMFSMPVNLGFTPHISMYLKMLCPCRSSSPVQLWRG